MERYLGLDADAARCTLAVLSQAGRRLRDFPLDTNGHTLVEAIRTITGHKRVVCDEGCKSPVAFVCRPHGAAT